MKYDAERLAIELVTKRRGRQTLTMRQTAEQIGVSLRVVHKAETRKAVSEDSFTKICAWLEMQPGAFFKEVKNEGLDTRRH